MNGKPVINILLSGNNVVFEGICLNVLSALHYTDAPLHLHLMTMQLPGEDKSITEAQCDKLLAVMREFNPACGLTRIDVSADYEECFAHSKNNKPVYTPYSLIRLFVQRYIDCDKLIYMDADTMVCKSLETFFEYDIEDKEMGVVLDYLGKFWIKKDYFNSGVLFINMKRVKETNLFENAIALLNKKKLFFADQSALYELCKDKLYLPGGFNEQRDIKPDTVIKHFNKGIKWLPFVHPYNVKQWQRDKVRKVLKISFFDNIYDMYDKYFK